MVNYADPEFDDGTVRRSGNPAERRERYLKRQEARKQRNAALPEEQAIACAKEDALTMLERANRSSADVMKRLCGRGYAPEVAQAAVWRLVEVNIIDDRALAYALVRDRFENKGVIGQALRLELLRKGIPADLADEAMADIDSGQQARRIDQLVQKKLRTLPQGIDEARAKARIQAFLLRKGYRYNEIAAALERAQDCG